MDQTRGRVQTGLAARAAVAFPSVQGDLVDQLGTVVLLSIVTLTFSVISVRTSRDLGRAGRHDRTDQPDLAADALVVRILPVYVGEHTVAYHGHTKDFHANEFVDAGPAHLVDHRTTRDHRGLPALVILLETKIITIAMPIIDPPDTAAAPTGQDRAALAGIDS
eukprot:SAG31_NODE_283_length_18512_cov_19.352414_6_plen_164_part_00